MKKRAEPNLSIKSLAECIEEVKLISTLITNSQSQFMRILDLISDDNLSADAAGTMNRSKWSVFGSIFRWLFGGLSAWTNEKMTNDSKIMWTYSCQIKTSNNNRWKKSSNSLTVMWIEASQNRKVLKTIGLKTGPIEPQPAHS